MTTDTRRLAAVLEAQSDRELDQLFSQRSVSPRVAWRDFYDTAEALLEPASIALALHAVSARDAVELRALATGTVSAATNENLTALGLLSADGTILAAVRDRVLSLTADKQNAAGASDPAHNNPADPEPVSRSAERAFTTVSGLADILTVTLAAPLSRIGSGAVSAHDRRRVAEANGVDSVGDVDTLLRIATTAGLVASHDRHVMVTQAGTRWLALSNRDRWQQLAVALVAALPSGLRDHDGAIVAPNTWGAAYPFDPDWHTTAARLRTDVELLGVLTPSGEATPWAAPLLAGGEPDTHELTRLLPHEVNQIYLQNDLTAISPGPLEPALDIRLRSMAVRESHAQASTYRFTATTLMDAVTAGETEASITEFLTGISLTGIPQPLAYLVTEAARRHGSVRVSTEPETGRTLITAESQQLLDTIAVDQALRPLGLVALGDTLASRATRESVALALAAEHYPFTLIAADGTPEQLQRHRIAHDMAERESPFADLIDRLRDSMGDDADAAWLERELDVAVRLRSTVAVTVAMNATDERTFTLVASGLGGGRLRGRDANADVERTLPLSHITNVEVVS